MVDAGAAVSEGSGPSPTSALLIPHLARRIPQNHRERRHQRQSPRRPRQRAARRPRRDPQRLHAADAEATGAQEGQDVKVDWNVRRLRLGG